MSSRKRRETGVVPSRTTCQRLEYLLWSVEKKPDKTPRKQTSRPSGHNMYRTVVIIRTVSGHYMYRQWSLYVPHSGHYMYRTVVTICTTSLTLNNSTFCAHSVFMCFVWISEQTAIISLYNINWLVFITETECVYCAVRTGCLEAVQARFSVKVSHNTVKSTHTHTTHIHTHTHHTTPHTHAHTHTHIWPILLSTTLCNL